MTNFTPEQIETAKKAQSAEELLTMASESGVELSVEDAKTYFEQLHPSCGELNDDELSDVSGGGCETGGHTVVTSEKKCFTGKHEPVRYVYFPGTPAEIKVWTNTTHSALRELWFYNTSSGKRCGNCKHLDFTSAGTGFCSKS